MILHRSHRLGRLVLLLSGIAATSFAQPTGTRGGVEIAARYSHTAESDLGANASVAIDSWRFGMGTTARLSEATGLMFGVDWVRHELDLSGPRWLPERLTAVALPVGISHRWDERWRLLLNLQPRLAGAGSGLSSAGFDVPVLALASYTASPDLTWSFGLRYSAHSDEKLLPIAGVVWRFAPDWEAGLTFPESGVSYRATPRLTWRAIATFHGGDFRLDEDPRAVADRVGVSLADAWLEYREIRAGVAAEYAVGDTVTLRADVGVVVDQRFDYFTRGVELEGESPAYFALSLRGRF